MIRLMLGVPVLLLVVTLVGCGGDGGGDECDYCDRGDEAVRPSDVTIDTGVVGISMSQSDAVANGCVLCTDATTNLWVTPVDEPSTDVDTLRAMILSEETEWTMTPVEGFFELELIGPHTICWQVAPGEALDLYYAASCTSFDIADGEVWTVHPFAVFSPIGNLRVFDPDGAPVESVLVESAVE